MAADQPAPGRTGLPYANGDLDPRYSGEPLLSTRKRGPLLQTTARANARGPSIRQSAANSVAGAMGLLAGDMTGFAQSAGRFPGEALDTARDIFSSGRRLVRPSTPVGAAAWRGIGQTLGDVVDGIRDAAAHPGELAAGVAGAVHDLGASVRPDIRPDSQTTGAQFRRNFDIGKNEGDLQFQGALATVPELRGLTAARAATREELVAKFLGQGFSRTDAEYLAEPYPWKGHHAVGRRTKFGDAILGVKLPTSIAGRPLPKVFMESQFNLVKPSGISRGEFYELHTKVDPKFHGTGGLPDSGRWSAKDLGVQRYDPIRRVWYGTPTATKQAAAGAAGASVVGSALAYPEQYQRGR